MDPGELIGIAEAARRVGCDPRTLHSRIRETGITTFAPGYDRRRRLIRVEDAEKLVAVRPAVPPAGRRKTAGVAVPRKTIVLSDAADAWPATEHAEDPA